MINSDSTLEDVCFAVSAALEKRGMPAVLTGGSAATVYAPHVYTSYDADFVLDNDDPLERVAEALAPLGFRRTGRSRIFMHAASHFSVDFPKGPLAVGGDYLRETASLTLRGMSLRILTRTDCIRDRLAHFYYWDDYTALNAAVGVAASGPADVHFDRIREWTLRESSGFLEKFAEFQRRLAAAG